jgi:hypothetical protein
MERVVRDGFVAVLTSPHYGAGWFTWHGIPELVYNPAVVAMVQQRVDYQAIISYCESRYPGHPGTFMGAEDLTVSWIKEGVEFVIEEYDGAENIKFKSDFEWMTA